MYDANGTTPAHTGNTLSAAASSSRNLFGRALFLVSANAVDERGEKILNSDSIFLRSSLRTRFNKLTISLVGSSGWRMARGTTSRDDNVRIEIMRTF
jgi:hypothetical protein